MYLIDPINLDIKYVAIKNRTIQGLWVILWIIYVEIQPPVGIFNILWNGQLFKERTHFNNVIKFGSHLNLAKFIIVFIYQKL